MNPRILVAEDSYALLNLLKVVLGTAGFDVSCFRDGRSALEAAQQGEFDLLLLDQQMPQMTGQEVVEAIRQADTNVGVPIFLCTAKNHELDCDYLLNELRIDDVLQKPFSPRELVDRLKSAVAVPAVIN